MGGSGGGGFSVVDFGRRGAGLAVVSGDWRGGEVVCWSGGEELGERVGCERGFGSLRVG